MTGRTPLSSINLLYQETGVEKFKLTYLNKIFNNNTLSYLKNILPERFHYIHEYNARNANDCQLFQQEQHYTL